MTRSPILRRQMSRTFAGGGGRCVVRSWQGIVRQRPFGLFSFAELRELPTTFPERGAPGAAVSC